jgi:hypothetical protein
MKYATSIFTFIFLFVAVFGFALMCHDMGNAHAAMNHGDIPSTCALSMLAPCTGEGIDMAIQHIAAYQSFSNITLYSSIITSLVLIVVAFAVAFRPHQQLAFSVAHAHTSHDRWRDTSQTFSITQQTFSRWLSLFENSPSFA